LLADAIPAVLPTKQVWLGIEARLFANKQPANRWWNTVNWWRGLALGTTGIATALALLMVMRAPQVVNVPVEVAVEVPAPTTVALLSDEQAKPAWLLALTKNKTGQALIKVSALPSLKPVLNKSFELWMLPADKTAPVSLGLLPAQGNRLVVVSNQLAQLLVQGGLAVSLEPVGGSPTGQPTGAVLYQGKLREI
jgi:anti-sigma-K factor RskA